MAKNAKVSSKSTGKAVVKKGAKVAAVGKEFVPSGDEVTGNMVWEFINANAGGNMHAVTVVPLSNVNVDDPKPTPFGYGRPNGDRATFHDFHIRGLDGDFSLGKILDKMRSMDGHSKQKMICTVALLNGGYSRSSKTWGIPFVKLVASAS